MFYRLLSIYPSFCDKNLTVTELIWHSLSGVPLQWTVTKRCFYFSFLSWVCVFYCFIYLFVCLFVCLFIFERERERERQRERETQNPKQAPGSELSAQILTRGSNPRAVMWDHHLSPSWTLHRLSHPGAPHLKVFKRIIFLLPPPPPSKSLRSKDL